MEVLTKNHLHNWKYVIKRYLHFITNPMILNHSSIRRTVHSSPIDIYVNKRNTSELSYISCIVKFVVKSHWFVSERIWEILHNTSSYISWIWLCTMKNVLIINEINIATILLISVKTSAFHYLMFPSNFK